MKLNPPACSPVFPYFDDPLQLGAEPWTIVLESSQPHPILGRYSYFMTAPRKKLIWKAGKGHFGDGRWQFITDPWAILQEWLAERRCETNPDLPPFQGGIAGLFSYDLARSLERLPAPRFDEFDLPDLAVGLFEPVLAFDNVTSQGHLMISRDLSHVRRASKACQTGKRLNLQPDQISLAAPSFPIAGEAIVSSSFSREEYLRAVKRAIDYIHAGDCFQVNLAQRLLAPSRSPLSLFRRLRERSPSPFGGLFLADDFAVISSSPERFIKLDADGRIETRPIKGTRPRRSPVEADAAAALELLYSDKDRAENVMIVDLLRNDLGKVSEYGSVNVETVCDVESYPSVHHLVSVVTGQLRQGLNGIDVLKAAFPGGSVTGAPKVRAMEIIAELEPTRRGPYCGSIGYIGFDGSMDTSITIRTYGIKDGMVTFQAGGGIVADSRPTDEYDETVAKARALIAALTGPGGGS